MAVEFRLPGDSGVPVDRVGSGSGGVRILGFGRLRVFVAGREAMLPATTAAVLARLVVARGRLVTIDEMYRDVWPDPPIRLDQSRGEVQKRIFDIRRGLGLGRDPEVRPALITERGAVTAYALAIDSAQVDLWEFEELIQAATGSDEPAASDILITALRRWTDRPLVGQPDRPFVRAAVGRLSSLRDQACRDLAEICRAKGDWPTAAAALDRLRSGAPDDDSIHRVVDELRQAKDPVPLTVAPRPGWSDTSAAELPDVDLRAMVERIRAYQSPTGYISGGPVAHGGTRPVPAELPPQVSGFTGRDREFAALDALLADEAGTPAVMISVVAGVGGVGKTALALRWAHHAAANFPDGQLYVDLRGFDVEEPLRPDDVLARFLAALGVPPADIPTELPAKAARYRTLLAGRRVLIVLDNARDSDQARPLLPGSPTCRVLVTSRDSLAGLVARDGARRLDLDVLPLPDAVALLSRLIGDHPADVLAELAQHCGRLPLALRIAAERVASRPDLSIGDLVAELSDERGRLDALAADERTAVRTVFAWSLRHLDPGTARLFRLLGLHPGADIDVYAAAALADVPVSDARQILDRLRRGYLVQYVDMDRVAMHDLVRAFAADLAVREETELERAAAWTRLLDYYLAGAGSAVDVFLPAVASRRPSTVVTRHELPTMSEPADGLTWLQAERLNLVALSGFAVRHGFASYAVGISATVWAYLLWHNDQLQDAQIVHTNAVRAARDLGDRAAEAEAVANLGRMYHQWDRTLESLDHFEQALAILPEKDDRFWAAGVISSIGALYAGWCRFDEASAQLARSTSTFREYGDRFGELMDLQILAHVDERRGRYDLALAGHRRAIELTEEMGDRASSGSAMINTAALLSLLGHHDMALEDAEAAIALCRDTGNRFEPYAVNLVGLILARMGRHDEALPYHERALEDQRRNGMPSGQADALNGLALIDLAHRRPEDAVAKHRQALDIYRDLRIRTEEAATLNHLGVALRDGGHDGDALAHHHQALSLARVIDDRHEQARALHGIALILHARGDVEEAGRHLAEARAIYADLKLPDADGIALPDETSPNG